MEQSMENPMREVEARKKLNFGARFVITLIIALTFFLIWLLFYVELPQASRDFDQYHAECLRSSIGKKSTDYWLQEKDDPEHKETEKHLENGKFREEQSGYQKELSKHICMEVDDAYYKVDDDYHKLAR